MRHLHVPSTYTAILCFCTAFSGCSKHEWNQIGSPWSGLSPSRTPLVDAILNNNRDEVKRLLDSGANPNQISCDDSDRFGNPLDVITPLAWAVSGHVACDTQILKMLIDHGADPNGSDSILAARAFVSYAPLNVAILSGLTSAVEFLLRHGANPNIFDPPNGGYHGWYRLSPLVGAIASRNIKTGKIGELIDRDRFGDTSYSHRQHVYDTIISTLLKYGASPTLAEPSGRTPLHAAAEYCDSDWAEKLIELGASLTAKDKNGNTPEDIAKKDSCTSVLAVIRRHVR